MLNEHVAFQLSVCHSRLDPCLACYKIANPLLNQSPGSTGRSADACQSCFSRFDDVNLELCRSEETSVDVTILMPAWQRGESRLIEVHWYHPSTLVRHRKCCPWSHTASTVLVKCRRLHDSLVRQDAQLEFLSPKQDVGR